MSFRSILRRGALCAAALLLCNLAAAQARMQSRSLPAHAAGAVNGLIVQLRDAPSHVEMLRERAMDRPSGADAEGKRWERIATDLQGDTTLRQELPMLAQAARRNPVGSRAYLLRFAQPLTPAQAQRLAGRLSARPEVEWVAPNVRERRQAIATSPPTDPYYSGVMYQWWLQLVQGSNASSIDHRLRGVPGYLNAWTSGTTGSASAVVAVLDTGITCHPDLGNQVPSCIGGSILPGYDFVSDTSYANDGNGRDDDPRDPGDWVDQADHDADPAHYRDCAIEASSWHGTVISGILAAQTNNSIGGAAVNWSGRVLPVRVAGKCGADLADIIDGMRWAAGLPVAGAPANPHPARIINISFGGSAACGAAYQQAIDELRAATFAGGGVGAVVIAAAGNEWGTPSRPANCRRAIGVGTLNRDGFKSNYSNFGSALVISTVGGDDDDGAWGSALGPNSLADSGLLTIGNSGSKTPGAADYFYHFGTSFSAPIVAGAVSLMLSVNPALTVDQIVLGLTQSARPHVSSGVPGFGECSDGNPGRCLCTRSTCGAGILDATQALAYAETPAAYTRPNWPAVDVDTPELRAAVASGQDRPSNPPPPPSGGGGGAMSAAWLLALALASAVLAAGRLSAAPEGLRVPWQRKARTRRPAQPG